MLRGSLGKPDVRDRWGSARDVEHLVIRLHPDHGRGGQAPTEVRCEHPRAGAEIDDHERGTISGPGDRVGQDATVQGPCETWGHGGVPPLATPDAETAVPIHGANRTDGGNHQVARTP